MTEKKLTDLFDTVVVAIGQDRNTPFFKQLGLQVRRDGSTDWPTVFVAGGNQYGWTWALNGNAAVSAPTATTSGSDVYAYSAKDFYGTFSAQAYAGAYGVSSMGAAANVSTQRSITASHTLIGIGFFPGPLAVKADATMHAPNGQSRSCWCPLSDFTGPGAAGPGTSTFTYTAVGAGFSNMADGVLGAADAYLPEP